MRGLRKFIAAQVSRAQVELAGLFLLHEDKAREEVVPCLALHELQDNLTNNTRRWNFLRDARTWKALPTHREHWLLDHVLGVD
jgi:hypothetical protein